MKKLLLILPLLCGAIVACSTYSANLTTTADSETATVDSPGPIAAGASVTSTLTPSGETVAAVSSNTLTLSAPALTSGTGSATFKNTLAVQLASNEKAYEQTIGVAIQTVIPLIEEGVSATAAANQVATRWGLEPANPTQNTAFSNIESDLTKAAGSATLLENYVTGLSNNGVTAVAPVPASAVPTTMLEGWQTGDVALRD